MPPAKGDETVRGGKEERRDRDRPSDGQGLDPKQVEFLWEVSRNDRLQVASKEKLLRKGNEQDLDRDRLKTEGEVREVQVGIEKDRLIQMVEQEKRREDDERGGNKPPEGTGDVGKTSLEKTARHTAERGMQDRRVDKEDRCEGREEVPDERDFAELVKDTDCREDNEKEQHCFFFLAHAGWKVFLFLK